MDSLKTFSVFASLAAFTPDVAVQAVLSFASDLALVIFSL